MDEEIKDLQVEKSECEKLEFGCAEAPRSLLGLHGWEVTQEVLCPEQLQEETGEMMDSPPVAGVLGSKP